MTPFDLNAFLPYQLDVLAERISREFAELYQESYGITIPEWRVVAHLSQSGTVSVREIHERVNMDKSRVSRAASRLEDSGYITKATNPKDKRLVALTLTPKGQAMVDDLAPRAKAFEAAFLARLGPRADGFRGDIAALLQQPED